MKYPVKLKYFLFLIILPFYSLALFSQGNKIHQPHQIKININSYSDSSIFLAQIYGDEINLLDTITTNQNGVFTHEIPYGTPKGVYRIILDREKNKFFDVVYNKNDIEVKSHFDHPRERLTIIKSLETKLYHQYQRAEGYLNYKENIIDQILDRYPQNDPFYSELENKYIALQAERYDSARRIIKSYPKTFVATLINTETVPFDSSIRSREEWQRHQKTHFFDHTDLTDVSLLRSKVIPNKILAFLSLYRNSSYSKSKQELEFQKATDTLIKYTQANAEIFDFTINFLIDGFKRYEFNQLIAHIADQTEAALKCINKERRDAMQKKIKQIRTVSPGSKAPNVSLPDINGDTVSLKSISKPNILVVFWASWCPHCIKMLPDLQSFYEKHNDSLEVYAISLDNQKSEWAKTARKYPWIHVSELNGWDSIPVEKYMVYGTPDFFLLDDNKRIVNRSGSLESIKNQFNKKPQD